jgi:hypothetical protein
MTLTPTQIMLISVLVDAAIRQALSMIENATEEEIKERIIEEQIRKDELMAKLAKAGV